ncbi:DUF1707 domain-containing protein [uncultured Corynebacterium sp.]|uniref:DUF1707 SHOCT-like domain-containing protein n=1 Tax=uncultured Corynebacterium sp. TaxID=159447 RepID=UPI0025D5D22F|nr:DUF1707 domain-containing protein [uncultured Corynebacterium sp.]
MNAETPAVRASDDDRRAAADALSRALSAGVLSLDEFDKRTARAYAAVTRAELAALTADLPAPALPAGPTSARSVSIFGGASRKNWTVPERHTSVAVFGGNELDLRSCHFTAPVTTIECVTMFGGIDIIVPQGVIVETDGAAIFGSFGDHSGDTHTPVPAGAPVVRVVGFCAFGGVSIIHKP